MSLLPGMSQVKIGNMALANIGWTGTIESINEESTEAKQIKLWYDTARVITLSSYNWSFAKKRAALALSPDDPPDDWGVRYVYPADCVRIRKIMNPSGYEADAIEWEVQNNDDGDDKTIVTDLEDALADYTFNVSQVGQFSPEFVDALAWNLAARIAFPITKKLQMAQLAAQGYVASLRMAQAADANEAVERKPREAEMIRGR